MIRRRVAVREAVSLCELHGVIQAAMGWQGIHLFKFAIRGLDYTSSFMGGEPASQSLSAFRFRKGAKFRYIYDMGDWWEHEVRVEDRFPAVSGKRYPQCTGGSRACPPEDCGGVHGFLAGQDEALGFDAMDDLAVLGDIIDRAILRGDRSLLDDDDERGRLEMAVERCGSRLPFVNDTFSRRVVNKAFRDDEHRRLMHQQIM